MQLNNVAAGAPFSPSALALVVPGGLPAPSAVLAPAVIVQGAVYIPVPGPRGEPGTGGSGTLTVTGGLLSGDGSPEHPLTLSGVATLGEDGKVPADQLPASAPVTAALPETTLISLGDSLTYGDQVGGPVNAWPAKLGALRNWTVTNGGQNGSALNSGGFLPMVSHWAEVVPSGYAGHVTLMGGTNDYTTNTPLGAPGTTDTATIYGALLVIARGVLGRSNRVALHLLTPLWRGDPGRTEGSRNSAGYTMEQVRQATRDVAAQVAREFPGQVQLSDVGRDLADWLSGAGYIGSDLLHPTAAGHTLIGQHLAMRLSGANGVPAVPQPVVPYTRTFSTLNAGPLAGQDGWAVTSGSYTVDGSGLTVNAAFNANTRGAVHALPTGATRARIRVTSGAPMLRFRLQDGSDFTYGIWLNAQYVDYGELNGDSLYGGQSWLANNNKQLAPAYPLWLELEQQGGDLHARWWADGDARPAQPQDIHSLGNGDSTLLVGGSLSLAHVAVPGVVTRIEVE